MSLTDYDLKMIVERVVEAVGPVVRQVVKEELAAASGGIVDVPPSETFTVLNGPDERGRVQYAELKGILPDHWFLDPLLLKTSTVLDPFQKAHIRTNAGCNDKGKLGPMGPLRNRLDKETNFVSPCFEVVPSETEGFFVEGRNGLQDKLTLANRNESYQELLVACQVVKARLGK